MTLVTSVLDRIARKCSVTTPSSWLTATGLQHVEIRDDFFEDTVSDILDRADMPEPIAATTSFTAGGLCWDNYDYERRAPPPFHLVCQT